jgi:hypothetical protein
MVTELSDAGVAVVKVYECETPVALTPVADADHVGVPSAPDPNPTAAVTPELTALGPCRIRAGHRRGLRNGRVVRLAPDGAQR